MEAKDRKAFIRMGISLTEKSIATVSQRKASKKTKEYGEKGPVGSSDWLDDLVTPEVISDNVECAQRNEVSNPRVVIVPCWLGQWMSGETMTEFFAICLKSEREFRLTKQNETVTDAMICYTCGPRTGVDFSHDFFLLLASLRWAP